MTIKLKKGATINIKDKPYIEAFEKMKILITSDHILIYSDFSKPFCLTTDASNMAIGAVLSQNHKPICYASRTLNEHEINYSTIDKELCIKKPCIQTILKKTYQKKPLVRNSTQCSWRQSKLYFYNWKTVYLFFPTNWIYFHNDSDFLTFQNAYVEIINANHLTKLVRCTTRLEDILT